jgi:hypothetical protein
VNSNLLLNKVDTLITECKGLLAPSHLTDAQINRLMEILKALVSKYAELIALPHLSEAQANQLADILELAQGDEILSNWLTEFDHASGHALGYLDAASRKDYRNYYALLKERCCHSNQQECENYQINCKFLEDEHNNPAIRRIVKSGNSPTDSQIKPNPDPVC